VFFPKIVCPPWDRNFDNVVVYGFDLSNRIWLVIIVLRIYPYTRRSVGSHAHLPPRHIQKTPYQGFWRSEVHFLRLRIRFVRQDFPSVSLVMVLVVPWLLGCVFSTILTGPPYISDATQDRTCTARAVVRSGHRTITRTVKKNWNFFLVPFRPSLSPFVLLPPDQNYLFFCEKKIQKIEWLTRNVCTRYIEDQ
jgi:hypothetical protein